jgi:membrane protease YdiL (CAAX protease family)
MVVAVLIDFHRDFLPDEVVFRRDPAILRIATLQRFVLLAAVPLAVVVLLFRDHPRRYGLRIGDWRTGLILAGAGTAIMLPIVVWAGHQPSFAAYYAPSGTNLPDLALTNGLDVSATEFMFRGFLMFTLLRTIGPLAILLAAVPFTFAHFGKPELETLSTLLGGSIFGWLDWRTGSILYSAAAHLVILTAVMVASMGWI